MAFAARLGLDRHLLVSGGGCRELGARRAAVAGTRSARACPGDGGCQRGDGPILGLQGAGGTGAAGEASEFNSPRFKQMMYRRVFYVRELLFARLNVLLTDTDIVFLRNPLPFMHGPKGSRAGRAGAAV